MKNFSIKILSLISATLFVCPVLFANTNFFGNVVISTNTWWAEAVYIADNLTVSNGINLTIAGGSDIIVSNNIQVITNANIICEGKNITSTNEFGEWVGEGVFIYANNVTVDAAASINADRKGYTCPGVNKVGNGPGGGGTSGDSGAGGGYGGEGGHGHGSDKGGIEYGNAEQPTELGSAGGGGDYSASPYGHGGGAIKLQTINSLILNGTISANGATVGGQSGGGAGGSLWIIVGGELSGSGSFFANGGERGNSSGGGGGGRIAVYFNNGDSFSGFETSLVNGGGTTDKNGGLPGNEGTIGFFKNSGINNRFFTYHRFEIQNAATSTYNSIDIYNGGNLTIAPESLINVENSFNITNGSTLTLGGGIFLDINNNLSVESNSTIYCNSYNINQTNEFGEWQGVGVKISASNIYVDVNGTISANGRGYAYSYSKNGNGPGGGTSDDGGGGGGHGGKGGNDHGSGWGGDVNDSPFFPRFPGSAGAAGWQNNLNGYGAGAIELFVKNSMVLDGAVNANASSGANSTGGGAGGAILVFVNNLLTGSGGFFANGGYGGHSSGGGGGGRIAVHYKNMNAFGGLTNSSALGRPGGGNGGLPGDNGTVFFFSEPFICITTPYNFVSYETTDFTISGTNWGAFGVSISNNLAAGSSNISNSFSWEINMPLYEGSNIFSVSGTNVFGQSTNSVVCIQRKTLIECIQRKTLIEAQPQIATNALIFPAVYSVIHASMPTNIFWNVEKITDDIDGTNLTISKITLHYADTTNFILEVTNNIPNGLGNIQWDVSAGSWDGETNYVLKFEVSVAV